MTSQNSSQGEAGAGMLQGASGLEKVLEPGLWQISYPPQHAGCPPRPLVPVQELSELVPNTQMVFRVTTAQKETKCPARQTVIFELSVIDMEHGTSSRCLHGISWWCSGQTWLSRCRGAMSCPVLSLAREILCSDQVSALPQMFPCCGG